MVRKYGRSTTSCTCSACLCVCQTRTPFISLYFQSRRGSTGYNVTRLWG